MDSQRHLTERQKKWIAGGGLCLFLLLSLLIFWFAGRPLIRFAQEPERFRQWVDQQGLWAHVLFTGMVILQVIVAVIPGEPLEIAAGYAFGAVEGTLLCVLGTFIGGILVFLLVRRFGLRAVEVFFPPEKLQKLRFFLPGTPKDVMCYFVGLTSMPLRTWALISAVARLPSIITSTVGGNALGMGEYTFAIIVFAATLVISGIGLLLYRAVCSARERRKL